MTRLPVNGRLEFDPLGREAEAAITALAKGETHVIGPNTNLNIFEPWRQDLPGRKLAIVTQPGSDPQGRTGWHSPRGPACPGEKEPPAVTVQ